MSRTRLIALGTCPIEPYVEMTIERLILAARYRFVECIVYVSDTKKYRGKELPDHSGARVCGQRNPPVEKAPPSVYIEVCQHTQDNEFFPCYIAPPAGTNMIRFLRRLEQAQIMIEDDVDGLAPDEKTPPSAYAITAHMLVNADPSARVALARLKEWEEQIRANLDVIRTMRDSVVAILLQENDEWRKQTTGKPSSSGLHQATKKRWRMYRILQAIKLVAKPDGTFDPNVALQSVRTYVTGEGSMTKLRFQKLGTLDKYYRAQRSGPFSLYYVTPKGEELLRELSPHDRQNAPRM